MTTTVNLCLIDHDPPRQAAPGHTVCHGCLTHALDATAQMPWMDAALCTQVGDPALWFEDSVTAFTTSPDGDRESAAKGVCRRCEVRAECLEYALATDERYGIWGGMTRNERLTYKRERRTA